MLIGYSDICVGFFTCFRSCSPKFKQHPKSSAQVAPFDVVGGFAEHAAGGALHAAIDGDFDLAALVFFVAFVWADLGECQQGPGAASRAATR